MTTPAAFGSILFPDETVPVPDQPDVPDSFRDLNIDQIIDAVIAGRESYDLGPFFYVWLNSVEAVYYRHEVMRDLENPVLREAISSFAQAMAHMRECRGLSARLHHRYQEERLFLDAAVAYSDAVHQLASDLRRADPASDGLRAFSDYLARYAESAGFTQLRTDARRADDVLSGIRYCLTIKGNQIRVTSYAGEPDYGDEIRATFSKFRQADAPDHRHKFISLLEMDHVEYGILQQVARLYPDAFEALDAFCDRHHAYLDATLSRFDREIQFYLAFLDYIAPLRAAGLSFSYPVLSADRKDVCAAETFDLALARKLVPNGTPVVRNDIDLTDGERMLVITGPNQGGKTTMARAFGQLHYLAAVGCPVPGRQARLFLADQVLTHFEREEELSNLSGKLQDDVRRIHQILQEATSSSVLVLNEIFTSTTPADALYLSREILGQVDRLDALCVCVTFLDELASFSPFTVSAMSMIVPGDPAQRTFKIVRRPADGFAYAVAIAEKYGLTYDSVKARLTA